MFVGQEYRRKIQKRMSRLTARQDHAFALAFSKVYAYEVEWDGTAVLKDWLPDPVAELPYLFRGEGHALLEDLIWNQGRGSLLICCSFTHSSCRKFVQNTGNQLSKEVQKLNLRQYGHMKKQTREESERRRIRRGKIRRRKSLYLTKLTRLSIPTWRQTNETQHFAIGVVGWVNDYLLFLITSYNY